jgi:murein DD-endopeptidase MepM/ murein hydrolase activator NlpD
MKARLMLMVLTLPISYLCYSQSTFLEKNREILDKMQVEVRKVVNDYQRSIQEMGFIEVYESSEENVGDINNTNDLNTTMALDEVNTAESLPDMYPLNSEGRLTSGYGYRIDPFTGKRAFHGGIDLAVAENTEVVSCGAGKIEKAGYNRTNGNYIIIDHGNKYKSYYGHLARFNVRKGDEVLKGQVIGLSGSTGMSTGPHLHFQITQNGKTIDPLTIIN